MCTTIKTNNFILEFGSYLMGLKKFPFSREGSNKIRLMPLYISNHQYQFKVVNDLLTTVENNTKQTVLFRTEPGENYRIRIQKSMSFEGGYHVYMFDSSCSLLDCFKKIKIEIDSDEQEYATLPVLFLEKDIQFIGIDEVVVERFSVPSGFVYFKLCENLNIEPSGEIIEFLEKVYHYYLCFNHS